MNIRFLTTLAAGAAAIFWFGGCVTEVAPARDPGSTGAAVAAEEAAPEPTGGYYEPAAELARTDQDSSETEQTDAGALVRSEPVLPPAVTDLVQRLTQPKDGQTLGHSVAKTTGFPGAMASLAPGAVAPAMEPTIPLSEQPPPRGLTADGLATRLIERDWTGIVLIPVRTEISKAHTTRVHLLRTEAHPMIDGRVRVWVRLMNAQDRDLPAEVACAFHLAGDRRANTPHFYNLTIPAGDYRDVFFVSPSGVLNSYTVLVRSGRSR
jgi:hypothetical protein